MARGASWRPVCDRVRGRHLFSCPQRFTRDPINKNMRLLMNCLSRDTGAEWPFYNSDWVFAFRNFVGTCASVTPSLHWPARPGQWKRTRGRPHRTVTDHQSFRLPAPCGSFTAGLILLGARAARGTDLPSKTQAPVFEPPPPAEFSWVGFYLGINAGRRGQSFRLSFRYPRAAKRRLHSRDKQHRGVRTHRRHPGRI